MEVEFKKSSEEWSNEHDYRDFVNIVIDGSLKASFFDGEIEDNNISRNFNDVILIPKMLKEAYEAGVRGEVFEIIESEEDDCD